MDIQLKNHEISIALKSQGGEMTSIRKKGVEYLWKGDSAYWGRHAPILFPQVGTVKDGRFLYEGQEYPMGQHGFARDQEFELTEQSDDRIVFTLRDNEDTRRMYPFAFELVQEYELCESEITARWIVKNTDEKPLYFSIGGHPAFRCPLEGRGDWSQYRIRLMKDGLPLSSIDIHYLKNGVVLEQTEPMELEEGCLTPSVELFSRDALILEDQQADRAVLVDPEGKDYLQVDFVCPVLGIWAPVGKAAPFVCIEPWYGRADGENFDGELKDREYGNTLEPGEVFKREYRIKVL